MWIFKDLNDGTEVVFSTEEKAITFIKEYGCAFYDENYQFPVEWEDYTLDKAEVDPDIAKLFDRMFD